MGGMNLEEDGQGIGEISVQSIMEKGAVTTEVGTLFKYFMALTERPILYFAVPCMVALLGRVKWMGEKYKLGSTSNRPVNILKSIIWSAVYYAAEMVASCYAHN